MVAAIQQKLAPPTGPSKPGPGPGPTPGKGFNAFIDRPAYEKMAPMDLLKYQKTYQKELKDRLITNRDQSLKDKNLPGDVMAYTQDKLMKHHYGAIQGMKLAGGTVFTHYHDKGNIMHESRHCYVLMNGKSPFLHNYPKADQHNAGQSFFHFLVIPKRNGKAPPKTRPDC